MLLTVWFGSGLGWLTGFEIFCWISLLVTGVGHYYKEVTIQKWQTVFLLFEIFDIGTNRLRLTPRVTRYYVLFKSPFKSPTQANSSNNPKKKSSNPWTTLVKTVHCLAVHCEYWSLSTIWTWRGRLWMMSGPGEPIIPQPHFFVT